MYKNFIYDPWIKKHLIRNYHVNSKDGYANLRSNPTTDSKILCAVLNDEYVCYIFDENEDDWKGWVKVYFPIIEESGYMHKSQLEER